MGLDIREMGKLSSDSGVNRTETRFLPRSGIRWHVFHARPRFERQADLALRRLGMETYLPLMIERWHGADRHEVAALVGYTLARFDVNAIEWGRDATSRQGCGEVGRFLLSPTTRMPANVPDAAVERLRAECEATFVVERQVLAHKLKVDDKARAREGHFSHLTGICKRSNKDRVLLFFAEIDREFSFRRDAVELVA
jgi:hypothetical protein